MSQDELPTDLAARWYEYWHLQSGARAEREALGRGQPAAVVRAHHLVAERVAAGGVAAVELLVSLAEAAPPGDDGELVGVGPLEDLLQQRDRGLLGVIATRARQSPSFGRALSHAVLPPDFSPNLTETQPLG